MHGPLCAKGTEGAAVEEDEHEEVEQEEKE